MDAFLLILTIVIAIILIIVNIYLLAIYCHPDDAGFGSSIFCKILVVFGLTLAWAQVLMLPLDVGNSRIYGGEIQGSDMETFWYIVYMAVAVMIVILIPFAMFFYESDEEKGFFGRLGWSIMSEICTIIIVSMILFISWAFLNYANIPIQTYAMSWNSAQGSGDDWNPNFNFDSNQKADLDSTLSIEVSFVVYVMALMSFFGWFLFVIFGGVGLSALPIDFIEAYISRPTPRTKAELTTDKNQLKKRCEDLILMGKEIEGEKDNVKLASGWWNRRKANGSLQSKINKFMSGSFTLDKDFTRFKTQVDYENSNPLIPLGKLILGICFVIVSLLWFIHILLDLLITSDGIPISTFLNKVLIGLQEGNAGFIATAIFGGLCLYLLWCCQKGNIKFGLRFFCISIHPMKENETWMNSFLFNVLLLLLCSVSVTQFCSYAFSQYARLSSIDLIFGTQIKYLRFFGWFFMNNVFIYALVIWAFVVMIYLFIRPSDKPDFVKDQDD